MALANAMWIHGHSIQMDEPDPAVLIRRGGPFARLAGGPVVGEDAYGEELWASYWFEFAIPTPAIMDDKRLQLEAVLLRFRQCDGGTLLEDIHVYDGEKRIAEYDDVQRRMGGGRVMEWRTEKFEVPDHPGLSQGLGISVRVSFMRHPETGEPCCIDFSSAGMWYSYVEVGYTVPTQPLKP
jgi:hypothetical protein